jgi:DNA-binding transcriptional MerR regulator
MTRVSATPPQSRGADGPDDAGRPVPPENGDAPSETAPYALAQLASLSSLSERTIRFYQAEGLLPAPTRQGRDARYDDGHLERLRIIGELQDRGFTLKSIRQLLDRLPADRAVVEWLGIHDLLSEPWSEERPRLLTRHELDEALASRPPGALATLERTGYLARQGATDTWIAPIPSLLDLALRLQDAGVDIDVSGAALTVLRRSLNKAAGEIAKRLLGRAGDGGVQDMSPAQLADALALLRPFLRQAAASLFTDELDRVLRERLPERSLTDHRQPRGAAMSRVRIHNFSISLDGFATGEGQASTPRSVTPGIGSTSGCSPPGSPAASPRRAGRHRGSSITRWPTDTDPGSVRRSWAPASSALRAGRTTRNGAGGGATTHRSTRRRTS